MDHLKTLKSWIDQYLHILLKKSQDIKNPINRFSGIIIRFVVEIKGLFKEQSGIDLALLQFMTEQLYCVDEKECQIKQHHFVKLLAKEKSLVVNSIQIFLRVTIMGLSLKISSQQAKSKHSYSKIWKKNFEKVYNSCQLQMSFLDQGDQLASEGIQFSALLLKFLYESEKLFRSFEFYENLDYKFGKLEVQPLIKWSSNRIKQLSKKMDQPQQNSALNKIESSQTSNKINLRSRKAERPQKKSSRVSFSEDPVRIKQNVSQQSALKKVLQSKQQQKKYMRRTIHQERKHTISRVSLDKITNSYFQECYYKTQENQQNVNKSPILNKKKSGKSSFYFSKEDSQQPETRFCVDQTPPRKKKRDDNKD